MKVRSFALVAAWCGCICAVGASPTLPSTTETNADVDNENLNNTGAPQDLYVIKTIVYEIGILTDAGNDTDDNTTHEQVDVTFFDPSHNGSFIDLSNIPVPIQTNVSGVSVTGLLPANLGSLLLPPDGETADLNKSYPALPQKQITVTQNISTSNPEKGAEIISNLPKLLGLQKNSSDLTDKTTGNNTKQA